jgi:threonine synthase
MWVMTNSASAPDHALVHASPPTPISTMWTAHSLRKVVGAGQSRIAFSASAAMARNGQGACRAVSALSGDRKRPFESMIGMLGATPVLELGSLTKQLTGFPAGETPQLLVKLESTNPGWSVKARPALHMLEEAEKRGDIGPGSVIIESSSGNTAIALAMVCSMKGYTFKPVVDVKMPQGKVRSQLWSHDRPLI